VVASASADCTVRCAGLMRILAECRPGLQVRRPWLGIFPEQPLMRLWHTDDA